MASDVDIVNIALVQSLGEQPITTLSGQTTRQVAARTLFGPNREALLTDQHWRFATETQDLARLATAPTDEAYSYAYQLPTDPAQLAVQRVSTRDYRIEGDKLLTNASEVQLRYTADVEISRLPAYFVMALGLQLGVALAIPITKSNSKLEGAIALRDDYLPKAKFADAQQQPADEPEDQPFIDVRA